MSPINIYTSIDNDTQMDFNRALKRKLDTNKVTTFLDLNSICKYLQFRLQLEGPEKVHFLDNIFKREDALLLLRYMDELHVPELEIDITLDTYGIWKDKIKYKNNMILNLKLVTVNYVTHREIYPDCEMTVEEFHKTLQQSRYDARVTYDIPIITLSTAELNSTLNFIGNCNKTPIMRFPMCSTYQEYTLNSIFPTKGELIRAILDINSAEIDGVIVENVPQCIFKDEGSVTPKVHFINNRLAGKILSVKGVQTMTYASGREGGKIPLCSECHYEQTCQGMLFQYK